MNGASSLEVNYKYLTYLNDDKIILWLGFNILLNHKKVFKVPIAFEENELSSGNQKLLNKLYCNKYLFENKLNMLLITKMGNTHPSRNGINKIFHQKNFCIFQNFRLDFEDFMNMINNYKFVLAPRGHGVDTHRFWEILLLGSVPVVESSELDDLYNNFNCIIVKSFQEINTELLNSFKYDYEKEKNIKKYLFIEDFNIMINDILKKIIFNLFFCLYLGK